MKIIVYFNLQRGQTNKNYTKFKVRGDVYNKYIDKDIYQKS